MTSSVLDFFNNLIDSDAEEEQQPRQQSRETKKDVDAVNDAMAQAKLGDSDAQSTKSRSRSGSGGSQKSIRWKPRQLRNASIDLRPQSSKLESKPVQSNNGSQDSGIGGEAKKERRKSARYQPPAARSRGSSNAESYPFPGSRRGSAFSNSNGNSLVSSIESQSSKWCNWESQELDKRKRALIGKTVVGKLSPKRGNRYFIKWNINANDTVVIGADKVEEVLGDDPPAGMWVSCTIVGLGPSHVQWSKQHPYAMALASRETRASHQPSKGSMPRNSPHWKKSQKAGLTRQVTTPVDHIQTVPAEIDMSRYQPKAKPAKPVVPSRMIQTMPSFPTAVKRGSTASHHRPALDALRSMPEASTVQPAVVVTIPPFAQHVLTTSADARALAHAANNGSVNLVTGEIKPRGRADSCRSWRKRDRSYTV